MSGSVGLLALQGDFQRHGESLVALGVPTREIRSPDQLEGLSGLVLPGGESTTFLRLLEVEGMFETLRETILSGIPVLATCGGLILLAEHVEPVQSCLGLLPIDVTRNGYGRQLHSGTFPLESGFLPPSTSGVFIRAPRITRVGRDADVLATWQGDPVLVRKGPILASCFHPELQPGHPLTACFADLVRGRPLTSPTLTES